MRNSTPPSGSPTPLQQSAGLVPAIGSPVSGIWQQALGLYLSRLSRKDKDAILKKSRVTTLNQDNVEEILQPLRSKYTSSVFSRLLEKINPVVEHILSFSTVIQVSLQAHPNPACLIWGGLNLVLEVSI